MTGLNLYSGVVCGHCINLDSLLTSHIKRRIVGEVIGKYHPHGDQAVYGTLVRMAGVPENKLRQCPEPLSVRDYKITVYTLFYNTGAGEAAGVFSG